MMRILKAIQVSLFMWRNFPAEADFVQTKGQHRGGDGRKGEWNIIEWNKWSATFILLLINWYLIIPSWRDGQVHRGEGAPDNPTKASNTDLKRHCRIQQVTTIKTANLFIVQPYLDHISLTLTKSKLWM